MARYNYFELLVDANGRPLPGGTVTVNVHGGGAATVYPTETSGPGPAGTATADTYGIVSVWLDAGTYDVYPPFGDTQVVALPQGLQGAQGIPGPIGSPGVGGTPKGAYNSGTAYSLGDTVYDLGQWYSSLTAGSGTNTGNTPHSSPASWAPIETSQYRNVAAQGADPTGAVDATAVFNATFALGSTFIPDGIYQINGVVTIPTPAIPDVLGAGSGRVELRLGSGGQIRVGNRAGTGGIPSGGRIGGFTINGNSVAAVAGGGLYIGLITNCAFPDIRIKGCLTDNVVIEAAQNCGFHNFYSSNCGGSCMVWDYGMGGNSWTGHTELISGGRYSLEVRQSGASPAGVYPTTIGPSNNTIYNADMENSMGGVLSNTQNLGIIYHGAGSSNSIRDGHITGSPAAGPYSIVIQEKANLAGTNAASVNLTLDHCVILDNNGHSTGIETRGVTSTVLTGQTTLANLVNGFMTWNTDSISVYGTILYATVTNKWVKAPASPATTFQAIVQTSQTTRLNTTLNVGTDDLWFAAVAGDAGARVQVNGLGFFVGDGTFAPYGVVGIQYYTPDGGATKYLYLPSSAWIAGNLVHAGSKSAVNGNTPVVKAAAITSPTSDTVGTKAAIDAIRVALSAFGITL